METQKLTFENRDGVELAGRLELPNGTPRAYALFAHCFTCSKDVAAASRISRELARRQIAVLRFDFTGLGNSAGDFANTNFSSNVADLVDAARYLESTGRQPELLVGHSLGGAAVLAAAPQLDSVRAVATIGAPSEPEHVRGLLEPIEPELAARGEARIELAGRAFTIKQQFLDDLDEQRLSGVLARFDKPLLLLHSPLDEIVPIEHARALYTATRGRKSFVTLDDADHLLTRRADSIYVAEILAAWASRYLSAAPQEPEAAPPTGAVQVTSTAEPFLQEIRAGRHAFVADEPTAVGGADAGVGPYELLLAGLGACTSMTLLMYARKKGWPLERARVTLHHDRVHTQDCEDCITSPETAPQVDRLFRDLELEGPLDTEQRARLLEIANRCPVHRTLEGPLEIPTRLVALP